MIFLPSSVSSCSGLLGLPWPTSPALPFVLVLLHLFSSKIVRNYLFRLKKLIYGCGASSKTEYPFWFRFTIKPMANSQSLFATSAGKMIKAQVAAINSPWQIASNCLPLQLAKCQLNWQNASRCHFNWQSATSTGNHVLSPSVDRQYFHWSFSYVVSFKSCLLENGVGFFPTKWMTTNESLKPVYYCSQTPLQNLAY